MKHSGLGGGFGRGLSMKPSIVIKAHSDEYEENPMDFKPEMEEVGDFIGRLLISAAFAHMLHLQTESMAKHVTLQELYEFLPDATDLVIEEFQGVYGIVPSYATYAPFNQNPTQFVSELVEFTRQNRNCMGPCESIQANIDTLITGLNKVLYKLKHLS